MARSPTSSSGYKPPELPIRRIVFAPSLIISSTKTAVPGAPMPWEAAVKGTPSFSPVTIVYSRIFATSLRLSHREVIRSTRAGSPQTKACSAMSPGRQPVIGCASLTESPHGAFGGRVLWRRGFRRREAVLCRHCQRGRLWAWRRAGTAGSVRSLNSRHTLGTA